MGFFQSNIFWFIEGVLAVIVIIGFNEWCKDHNIKMYWWKWTVFILVLFTIGFTVTFITTSLGEREVTAALRGGIIFGSISIIFSGICYRIIMTKK